MGKKFEDRERESHPSFGVIGWSRQTTVGGGPGANLFGSDLKHGNLIAIHVSTASRERSLSNSWIFEDKKIVEVVMSASQFADFLTTPNQGSGVPCTIRHNPPEYNIEYPSHQTEKELHGDEFKETLEGIEHQGREIKRRMKEMSVGGTIKKKEFNDLMHDAEMMIQDYHSNLPYVLESFERSMEKTVSSGKAEIENYIESRIRERGVEALTEDFQAPQLVDKKKTKLIIPKKETDDDNEG
jgi:hypothetical protein